MAVMELAPTGLAYRELRCHGGSAYVRARSQGYCEGCGFCPLTGRLQVASVLIGAEGCAEEGEAEGRNATNVGAAAANVRTHSANLCRSCLVKLGDDVGFRRRVSSRVAALESAIETDRLLVVTALVIDDGRGRILVAERERSAHGAAAWEFPGGKVEAAESLADCIVREIHEELAVVIEEPLPYFMADHSYQTFDIRLCTFRKSLPTARLTLQDHRDARLVALADLSDLALAGADRLVAKALVASGLERW